MNIDKIIWILPLVFLSPLCAESTLDLNLWKDKYAKKQDVQKWNEEYKLPYNSWFGDEDNVAQNWFFYFGPLGIRVNAHDVSWGGMKSFKKRFPDIFVDRGGELALNVIEVLHIIPGSPAEGKLEVGDCIVEMEGESFKPSNALEHGEERYQFQDVRSLEMHAGELLDAAEARGEVKFRVIRPSKIQQAPEKAESLWKVVIKADFIQKSETERSLDLNIPVKGGELCKLIVDEGGNGNGGDNFTWTNMVLKGSNGTEIELTDLVPFSYQVGWGSKEVDPEKRNFPAHGHSEIILQIPEGNWILSGKGVPDKDATVEARVELRPSWQLPKALEPFVQEVTVPIPKLGSYAQEGITGESGKVQKVIEMTGAWLAAQQNDNGSWTRPAGYTAAHYDTALAGLALMATENKAYDDVIKKAAEFVAFSGTSDGWSTPLATATVFLCEYWLRYKDDRVLQAISNAVKVIEGQMLYGDYTSGHGHNPGYDGTGVSIGGSHCALALALAAKTPVKFNREIVDKMLARAQEISPRGVTPYGRTTDDLRLDPDLKSGATYSGRHGPYLVASYIHGGPKGFVKNCSALYTHGVLGGADQGHSTETLSLLWTFPASASIGKDTLYRQMNSFLWKLTMLRGFDGGFCFNANRMEYQGAEGVLNVYIRTSAWLLGLCADKHNLAITGKSEYKAKSFKDVPQIAELEVRILSYYQRNWALVLAALGKSAPVEFKEAYKKISAIPASPGCREILFSYLKETSIPLAKKMLSLTNIAPLQRAYYAEIMLGLDTRITIDAKKGDGDKPIPGEYKWELAVHEPFWGHSPGVREGETQQLAPIMDFSGSVRIVDPKKYFPEWQELSYDSKKDNVNYRNLIERKGELKSKLKPEEQTSLKALISYKVGDFSFEYERPIIVNRAEEWNPGRKLYNDRLISVPGYLMRDHGQWGLSFLLSDGTYISASAQERSAVVHDLKTKTSWVTPRDRSLPAGSAAIFQCSTGWYGLEARVPELKLIKEGAPSIKIKNVTVNGKSVDVSLLQDNNCKTKCPIESKDDGSAEIIAEFEKTETIRGIDFRDGNGPWWWSCPAIVSIGVGDSWKDVYWSTFSRTSSDLYDFSPEKTKRIKIRLKSPEKFTIDFSELHIFGPSTSPSLNKPEAVNKES